MQFIPCCYNEIPETLYFIRKRSLLWFTVLEIPDHRATSGDGLFPKWHRASQVRDGEFVHVFLLLSLPRLIKPPGSVMGVPLLELKTLQCQKQTHKRQRKS
jgi:hypothetical protein